MTQDKRLEGFVNDLPYELTAAQKRVYEEIEKDMTGGMTMNRLVQGDDWFRKDRSCRDGIISCRVQGEQGAFMVPGQKCLRAA